MRRLLWLYTLLLFLGQATGVLNALDMGDDQSAAADCADDCADDCPDEHCPPQCHDCLCGVTLAIDVPRASLGPPVWRFPAPDAPPAPPFARRLPGFPDPREILRVPRAHTPVA
jgi:hypothetical protein